jgi:arylsulfatase
MMKGVAGGVRDQYHHAVDIVPTILDCLGVTPPDSIRGYTQSPIQGMSMRYSFDKPNAPSVRLTQYYAMLGTRAIYHDGWKAVARHGAISGKGHFMDDKWELYHTAEDRAELHDLAAEQPEKLKELIATWFAVAGRNNVFPLDDRTATEIMLTPRPQESKPRNSYIFYPDTSRVPQGVAPIVVNRSYSILANVSVDTPEAEGVIFCLGDRFGGHSMFIKDGRLFYVYNFIGIEEEKVVSTADVPTGPVVLGVEFVKEKEEPRGVANGTVKLYFDDRVVGEGHIRTQPGKFGLSAHLTVGRGGPDPVSSEYKGTFPFRGGVIKRVSVNLSGEPYVNEEVEARAMLARE